MIDVHYIATANGMKIAIALEELNLPHKLIKYDMFAGEHLTLEFRRLNPNNKLPVIVDKDLPDEHDEPIVVFESGAILWYLAEKTGRLLPKDFRSRTLVHQWLQWQVSGLGPMHGQAHHFVRYAPKGEDYSVNRYTREALRLLNVLAYRLREVDYLAGDYSIADIACYPWVKGASLIDIDIDRIPEIKNWCARLEQRPAIANLADKPEFAIPDSYLQQRAQLTPEQWSNMFGDSLHNASRLDKK